MTRQTTEAKKLLQDNGISVYAVRKHVKIEGGDRYATAQGQMYYSSGRKYEYIRVTLSHLDADKAQAMEVMLAAGFRYVGEDYYKLLFQFRGAA